MWQKKPSRRTISTEVPVGQFGKLRGGCSTAAVRLSNRSAGRFTIGRRFTTCPTNRRLTVTLRCGTISTVCGTCFARGHAAMKIFLQLRLLLLTLSLLLTFAAFAQAPTGDISGTVYDESGAVVPAAIRRR